MFIVTSKQMYEAECSAVSRGTTFADLMEKAGYASAKIIYDSYCKEGKKKILVVCGKGKNGGDGFVIARALWEKGCSVSVLLACGEPKDGISLDNFNLLDSAGIDVFRYDGNVSTVRSLIRDQDIYVDAVFGTGFRGKLDPDLSLLAQTLNAMGKTMISIDVPSGADCDNASLEGEVFLPDMTIAISALKPIHVYKPANTVCGKIKVADIGITDSDFESIRSLTCFTLTDKDIKKMLPKRNPVSNKGTYGHALCICGSKKMPGAACMSVSAALRCGTGLVTAAFPGSAYPAISAKMTECLMLPTEESLDGCFSHTSLPLISETAKKCNAALIGCGMGFNQDTVRFTEAFLKDCRIPLVIDADALNVISKNPDILRDVVTPAVLTPHPGEMSRLTGKSIKEIVSDPVGTAWGFAKKYNCTVVLKVANTVICDGGNSPIYINTTGNSGLSKGGSGDVLAGMIVSLLAQGMKPFDAAAAAVYMHGDCADEIAESTSMRGMLPTDIIAHLPVYFGKFE